MDPKQQAIAKAMAVINKQVETLLEMLELLQWLRTWFPGLVVGTMTVPDPSDETAESMTDAERVAYAEDCQAPIQAYTLGGG